MTEEEYRLLCTTCDSVLLEDQEGEDRIAISWLHILREHPVFLAKYEGLFSKRDIVSQVRESVRQISVTVFCNLRLIWSAISKFGADEAQTHQTPCDIIFISHLLSTSQLTVGEDFYFGTLPTELSQQGFSVIVILINHTPLSVYRLSEYTKSLHARSVIIPRNLPFLSEFKFLIKTKRQAKLLRQKATAEKNQLKRAILFKSAREATSNSTMTSMRISEVVGSLVRSTKPRAIVSTYEGHSWERLAFSSARRAAGHRHIKCIGYQHAALFRLQHASRRLLGGGYDPDIILTAGEVGLSQLTQSGLTNHVICNVLGSRRLISPIQKHPSKTCVVLPEGILSECEILFSFSLECALKYPYINFIWRLHPILSWEDMARIGIHVNNLPDNILVSDRSLEKDLSECRWAIYRGSTAIITAGANGIIPIYLARPDELTINPLYEIADSHESIVSTDSFIRALEKNKWSIESEEYCRKFYTRFELSKIADLL